MSSWHVHCPIHSLRFCGQQAAAALVTAEVLEEIGLWVGWFGLVIWSEPNHNHGLGL
jgi:hypothetical protein